MTVRKEGKARWVYTCPNCWAEPVVAPDQFRAIEARNAHQRTTGHVFKSMAAAWEQVTEAYAGMARAVVDTVAPAMGQMGAALAQPLNTPYGPPPMDKRTWGGK